MADFELRLARTEQVHECNFRRCLVPSREGFVRCKRRAPFKKTTVDYIKPSGKWCQRREYEYMNGWIPAITVNVRCNNDGKLLTNGQDTKNISMYSIKYGAKAQGKHFNMSAILAKGYAYHEAHPNPAYVDSLREQQRLMIFRLLHTINREQELAAAIVMAYLMGWGDTHCSHNFATIFWSTFVSLLLKEVPELRSTVRKLRPPPSTAVPDKEDEESDEESDEDGERDVGGNVPWKTVQGRTRNRYSSIPLLPGLPLMHHQ
jgi:hypothetical protein